MGRRTSHLTGKSRILILCEGAKTEPNYFNWFKFEHQLTSVLVLPPRKGQSGPQGLLKRLRSELRVDPGWDEAYCVLDHDERDAEIAQFEAQLAAFNKQRTSTQIEMVMSKPCFEMWLLLHFVYSDRPFVSVSGGRSACDEVTKQLQLHVPEYRKNTTDYLGQMQTKLDVALANADRLNHSSDRAGKIDLPHTSVDRLVARLLRLHDGLT